MGDAFARLLAEVRSCRICIEHPHGRPLPHEPRPVLRAQPSARLAIYGQAPGTRVHASGTPFLDPSGDRLRAWMETDPGAFYDTSRIAILPMGFCFPGLDAKGSDLPPRRECASAWRDRVLEHLPNLELALLVGQYAQRWHLGAEIGRNLTETVGDWRRHYERDRRPRLLPLPHPSWRNNAWIKRNAWFERDLLPVLRAEVGRLLAT